MSRLILTRHGQSTWNAENRFTGWVDVDLSEKGKEEAKKSGELILELLHHFIPNRAFELNDLYANSLGVMLAFLIFKFFKKLQN